jgi:hypothetical protein
MRPRILGTLAVVVLVAAFAPASAFADDGPGDDEDELEGVIQSLPGTSDFVGNWVVSGTTVHVTADTEIDQEDGAIVVGVRVEVKGTPESDGSITADRIEVESDDEGDDDGDDNDDDGDNNDDDQFGQIEFEGFVQALPPTTGFLGDWTVSGLTVHVTADTEIDQEHGAIAVGSAVKVEGLLAADGSVTAREIQSEDATDVDEHTMSLTGTATVVPNADHTGRWRVSTHSVQVREGTRIVHERRLERGSTVRVLGSFRPNGSMRASKIVVK